MISHSLKFIRKYHDLTATELAKALKVSCSYISEIENNKKRLHTDMLEKYSEYFNMPISAIFLLAEWLEKPLDCVMSKYNKKVYNIKKWIVDLFYDPKENQTIFDFTEEDFKKLGVTVLGQEDLKKELSLWIQQSNT